MALEGGAYGRSMVFPLTRAQFDVGLFEARSPNGLVGRFVWDGSNGVLNRRIGFDMSGQATV